MITNITLENFKCFRKVEVNPRRITVFVGPNGTGKSSVLQALALLKQSVPYDQLIINSPFVNVSSLFAPLNIVHFDAHLDYSHDYQGVLQTHGSPIRRCRELPFVNHITSIGIRTARRRPYEQSQQDGSLIISTKRFRQLGPAGVVDLIPKGENLYITFDIDVMDPSQAPGTGTPEVGGLYYQEARECLSELVRKSNLVGFDLVEVAPPYDLSELTSQLGAQLIIDILAARFPSK